MSNYLNYAILALVAFVAAILFFLLLQGLARPVLAKIGLRNISRRRAQSALIVIGLTLSTIIIVSALSIGDTLTYSVQRQAVAAYGEVDEIIAPPLLSSLATSETPTQTQTSALQNLTAGGLTSTLAILNGGLPGISTQRYAQLRDHALQEPLIDGVAGAVLFPTIIRNTTTGQGEPLGFVFAVDQDYDEQFGITTVQGQRVRMNALQSGVGNIFLQANNVFSSAQGLVRGAGLQGGVSDAVLLAAGAGAALVGAAGQGFDLTSLSVSTQTLRSLGIDTAPLEAQGIQTVTLASLGITTETLRTIGQQVGITDTTNVQPAAILSNTLGLDTSQILSATQGLLASFNLNTLGRQIDSTLEPFGLQLRQGDVYLNKLGAERLNAQPGDVLEVFVGPIPIPMRVKAIVEEAGPVGALLPVVMLRLDEAQKLFFMNGKVNAVLVSNQGDELEGMQHTEAVSDKLRVLAMDEVALNDVVAILRRPAVKNAINTAAANPNVFGDDANDQPPPWIATILQNYTPIGGLNNKLRTLPAELDKPDISDALRLTLTDSSIRAWLLGPTLLLAANDNADLSAALSQLNQFDVIDPLSKATVTTVANAAGGIFTSVFSLFGIFSILAAIMLIFLIFVMLAAERRTEMGIARAVGVQRSHLVQMFVTEGMAYDLLAAAMGVGLGLAVSYAMIGFLGNLVNNVAGQFGSNGNILQFQFHVAPASIVVGYCLGVLFTYLTVVWSSWRVSRLNIVSAIRNLPEESNAKRRSLLSKLGRWVIGPLLFIIGAGVLFRASQQSIVTLWQMGGTLVLMGLMLLLERLLERTVWRAENIRRVVYSLIGIGLLGIWGAPWNQIIGRSGWQVLVNDQVWILASLALSGPLLIIGAILVIMNNADALAGLFSRLLGNMRSVAPILKTAIAYPLTARFRTAMAMTMFAMIIATVVIMAVVIQATQSIITLDAKSSAGFEISTSNTLLSFFSPLQNLQSELPRQVADYPRLAEIEAVGGVKNGELIARQVAEPANNWSRVDVSGVDAGYLQQAEQVYKFALRAPGYADDAAVWQALRERNDVAIVTPDLLAQAQPAQTFTGTLLGQNITKTVSSDEVSVGATGESGERRGRFGRALRLRGFTLADAQLPPTFIEVRNSANPSVTHQIQIIGVLAQNTTLAGQELQLNLAGLSVLRGEITNADRYYLKTRAGADVKEVAQEVERAFLPNGLDVTVMAEQFAIGQNITRGVLRLFQGFMALGLLVGIAALGVISTRTVVERRQQIGVLRAIGFQSNTVAFGLVLEASFIALAGLLIGAGTGLLLGQYIVRTFFVNIAAQTQFTLPWLQIGFILLLAYSFSLLTTIVPAMQAARIYPAEALMT
jgi:putative ABC transport system permease protein